MVSTPTTTTTSTNNPEASMSSTTRTQQANVSFYRGAYTIWLRQLLRLRSSPARLISFLLMPIIWIAVFGKTFNNLLGSTPAFMGQYDYLTYFGPGILVMVILFTATFGAVSLFYDKESGFMKIYLVAPIPRISVIVGYNLGTLTIATLQFIIMYILELLIGVELSTNPLDILFAWFILMTLATFLIGFVTLIASKAPNVEVFQALIMPIVMPLQFASNIMYPIEIMPEWLQWVAKFNPLSYAVDAARGILISKTLQASPFDIQFIKDHIMGFDVIALIILAILFNFTGNKAFIKNLSS